MRFYVIFLWVVYYTVKINSEQLFKMALGLEHPRYV